MASLQHLAAGGTPLSYVWSGVEPIDECLIKRVRGQFDRLEHHVPTLREVAKALAVSERTLRRRLRAWGTSYSDLLQEVRRELAESALIHSNLTVDQVAAMLGYTETTNFRHAFRRWVGASPHAFRKQARARPDEEILSRAA